MRDRFPCRPPFVLEGVRCAFRRLNSLPANHPEEEPCRPVFTVRISSTRTRNNPFRNRL
jgi:hypothetical protein